ncbi:uncharacterized protein GBIM_21643, partial [Gryllus bimaculatus]
QNSLVLCTLLLAACGALAFPQRNPGYAPNGVDYPRPFGSSSDEALSDRFGGAASTPRYDAYGHDVNVVNKVAALPESQQPFWYRNRDRISDHIGLSQTG